MSGPPEEDAKARKATLLVAALAFLVFLPSIGTAFIFDDALLIVQNEFVHAWRWLPRAFTTHFWDATRVVDTAEVRRYYRPIVTVSYLVTWALVGARPWVFHLTNVILHALTSGLVVRAARRWTASVFSALVIGMTFALHPSRTENVTWISGRTDVLMTLFALVALEAFAAFERWRTISPPRARLAFAGGLVAVILATLSKEPATMIPIVLLAEYARPAATERKSRLPILVTALGCGAYLGLRAVLFPPDVDVVHTPTPLHALVTMGAYVQRTLVPWPPTMYFHALISDGVRPIYPPHLLGVGAITFIAALAALGIAWRRSRTAFWLLIACAAFMGPLLNVYFTGMNVSAQDRFLYAPLLFALGGIAVLLREPFARIGQRRMTPLVIGGLSLVWSLIVAIRTLDYRSEEIFWTSELHYNPKHPYVLTMLAQTAAVRGDLVTADDYFRRTEEPEAKRYFLASTDGSHFQRAVILAALLPDGRTAELSALFDELWRLIEPQTTPAHAMVLDYEVGGPLRQLELLSKVTTLQWDIALLATRLGEFERAERVIRQASGKGMLASASPLNDALALARMGKLQESRKVYQEIKDHPEALGDLARHRELSDFDGRLARATRLAAERDRADNPAARAMTESMRLAELGAYLAALRALDAAGVMDLPETTPLTVQLLVACRLDDAARERARRDLGQERGDAIVDGLRRELPPRLRAMPPVQGDAKTVLPRARP